MSYLDIQISEDFRDGDVWSSKASGLKNFDGIYWVKAPENDCLKDFSENMLKKAISNVFSKAKGHEVKCKGPIKIDLVFPSFKCWPALNSS